WRAAGLASLCLAVMTAAPAEALIIRLTPLSEILEASTWIVTAKVESLDKSRPAMVLAVDEALKGKAAQKKLPVLLEGGAGALKRKEPPQLLERLQEKLRVVVFITVRGEEHLAFVYSNGTWFSLSGAKVDGEVRWSLSHLEPYLRRTYKGTTAQMAKTVR